MPQGDKGVEHKGRTDLVTDADLASEAYLIGEIRKAFPDHAINAENPEIFTATQTTNGILIRLMAP